MSKSYARLSVIALFAFLLTGCTTGSATDGGRALAHPVLAPRTDEEALAIAVPLVQQYFDTYIEVIDAVESGVSPLLRLVTTTYVRDAESMQQSMQENPMVSFEGGYAFSDAKTLSIETKGKSHIIRFAVCIDYSNAIITFSDGSSTREQHADLVVPQVVVAHDGEGEFKLAGINDGKHHLTCGEA